MNATNAPREHKVAAGKARMASMSESDRAAFAAMGQAAAAKGKGTITTDRAREIASAALVDVPRDVIFVVREALRRASARVVGEAVGVQGVALTLLAQRGMARPRTVAKLQGAVAAGALASILAHEDRDHLTMDPTTRERMVALASATGTPLYRLIDEALEDLLVKKVPTLDPKQRLAFDSALRDDVPTG